MVLGVFALSFVLRYENMPVFTFLLAVGAVLLSLVPLLIWIRSADGSVPIFPLVCFSYGNYTGFGAITQPNQITILSKRYVLDWEYIDKALLLSFFGLVLMESVFFSVRRFMSRTTYNVDLPIDPAKRLNLIFYLVGSAMLVSFLFTMGWIPWGGHIQIIQGFLLIAVILAASFYYRGNMRGPSIQIVLGLLLFYVCSTGLATGMLETVFVPILAIFVVRFTWLRRFPVIFSLLGLIVLGMVNSSKMDYRQRVWINAEAKSYAESMVVWADILRNFNPKTFFLGESGLEFAPWRQSLARTSVIDRIAWVCSNTPERIPYLKGESYLPFLYAPVPRILWPNKPILSEALTNIDAIYDLAVVNSQGNLTAAVGVSYIGEGYANFGVLGVGVVMMLQGLILAVVDAIYNRPSSEGGVAIFMGVAMYMINGVGSSAINLYGILFQSLTVSSCALLPFVVKGWNTRSRRPVGTNEAPRPNAQIPGPALPAGPLRP